MTGTHLRFYPNTCRTQAYSVVVIPACWLDDNDGDDDDDDYDGTAIL
jgi:hypothetical protein